MDIINNHGEKIGFNDVAISNECRPLPVMAKP
jgi:hypothetical protein